MGGLRTYYADCLEAERVVGLDLVGGLQVVARMDVVADSSRATSAQVGLEADAAAEEEMRKVRHSIQLPPGFKLPF